MSRKRDDERPRRPRENGQRPSSEYDRFERLTKRLLQVPKKEIGKAKKRAG